MTAPEHFDVEGDLGRYHPTGRVSLEDAVKGVTSAIRYARAQKLGKLLVDTRALTGFEPPSISDRLILADDWARASGGVIRLAIVARPEMIHPQKFAINAAVKRGAIADVFTSEQAALEWLAAAR